jgi:signal transduction histidine kinase
MSLQNKFRFLLTVFGVSIVANMLVSVWCIRFYFGNASRQFTTHMQANADTNTVRIMIDRLMADLSTYANESNINDAADIRERADEIADRVNALVAHHESSSITRDKNRTVPLAQSLPDRCQSFLQAVANGDSPDRLAVVRNQIERECADPLRQAMALIAQADDVAISATTADMMQTQERVTALLSANAVAAFLLAAIGVFLVRNWVLKPLEVLMVATDEHSKGNLHHRIDHHSRDELGALSKSVNRMADSLLDIQKQLVQQERLAALGEVASMVAHNIRNPLAGIRASAQSAMGVTDPDSPAYQQQLQVVETVDSLNQWLKQLLLVNRPLELQRRRVPLRQMVEAVLAAQRSNAQRRLVSFKYEETEPDCSADVDPRHIEQAIQVLVDNALDASPEEGEVCITAVPAPGSDRWVDLSVHDHGPGIPDEVRDRITAPYFTTKPGGTGIGLHLAKKAVESHGGEILFSSPDDGGTTVTLRLPTRVTLGA